MKSPFSNSKESKIFLKKLYDSLASVTTFDIIQIYAFNRILSTDIINFFFKYLIKNMVFLFGGYFQIDIFQPKCR